MAFHYRKLLDDDSYTDPSTVNICKPYCNEATNPESVCPDNCLNLCPDTCKTSVLDISPPPPPPPPPVAAFHPPPVKHSTLPLPLAVSLSILAVAFFVFTCYTVYKLCCYWNSSRRRPSRRREAEEGGDGGPDDVHDEDQVDHPIWYIRTIGLQPSVISTIAVVKYKKGDGLIEGTDCSVCLSEFQEDETLRLLPKCNHAFHIPCIDTWLRSHTNCPMCRAGIVNCAAPVPLQEVVGQNSEGNQSGGGSGSGREEESEGSDQLRIRIEDEGESRARIELKVDEEGEGGGSGDAGGLEGVQPVRRSVSFDSLSASAISTAIGNAFPGCSNGNSDKELVEEKESAAGVVAKRGGVNQSLLRLVGSPSMDRSMQMGSSSIRRSLSCSAKVFLSRHSSRSRASVIPR